MRFLVVFAVAGLSLCVHAQGQLQNSHSTASLRGVAFAGKGVAWASGSGGTVLRTVDMGVAWQRCATPAEAEALDFRGVQAFDANTALVMSSGKGDLSRVYKTTDGCKSWKLVFTNSDEQGFWDALFFADKDSGYLFGDPVDGSFFVAETKDGGNRWTVRHDKGLQADPKMSGIFAASNSSAAISDGYLMFGSGGKVGAFLHEVVRSGAEWHSVRVPLGEGNESAGFFGISPDAQVAVGGDYKRPEDGRAAAIYKQGKEWKTAATQPHGFRSAVAYDAQSKTWIAVGPNGTDISRDGGKNWQALLPRANGKPDEDKHWNALSLPFAVGSQGQIGVLRHDALTGK